MRDRVHIVIGPPPSPAVLEVIGFSKGKSAIHLLRVHGERHGFMQPLLCHIACFMLATRRTLKWQLKFEAI